MTNAIIVRIDHPTERPGPIKGFRYFWAFYVNGFNQTKHCQPCFKGKVSQQIISPNTQTGRVYVMDEAKAFKYLYICGVGVGPKDKLRDQNLHMPLEFRKGHSLAWPTYNGYVVNVMNAVPLTIPALEPGWKGIDDEQHTRCKNFQFGVAYFGWRDTVPSPQTASPAP